MNNNHLLIKRGSIFGIIGNIFLFIIKIVIGIISKSQALIADAMNSASDIFASFMTYIGNRISSVPNDKDHNFGHGKAEYIFTMLISISMMIIALKLCYDSIFSIINHNELIFSYKAVVICIITFIVKLSLFLYTNYVYKVTDSILIKSNMIDHRNDMVITFFTTAAIMLTLFNVYFFDGLVGIGISVWILLTGIRLFKESYDVLMDMALDKQSNAKILKIIKQEESIKRIGNLYSIPIGHEYIVVVTIFVDGKMKTVESHEITNKIEQEIKKEIPNIQTVIVHVEPFNE